MENQILQVADYQWQIIINPNAKLKKCCNFWDDVDKQLKKHHIQYEINFAKSCDEGKIIVKQLCKEAKRHFIVVGGDGTLNAIVNGIFESEVPTQEVFLAVIPLGNGNDWTRTHHYPSHFLDCIDVFLKGSFDKHDIGLINTIHDNKIIDHRYFINIAGFCFDAQVIYEVVHKKIKIINSLVYLICLIKTLFFYKSQRLRIESDSYTYHDNTYTIAIGICQFNGGGMRQVPMAKHNDGLFDIIVIRNLSKMKVIKNVKRLFDGSHVNYLKELSCFQTDKLTIRSEENILGEVEGELITSGDYEISMLPKAINVLVNNN